MKDRGFDPEKNLGEGIKHMSRQELCALVSELCAFIRSEVGADGYRGGIFPENISLNADGSVALGGAKMSDWEGQELQFIAPELFWGGKLGPASDVYSLGLLLYYGLTGGKLPFSGEEAEQARADRMNGKSFAIPASAGRHLGAILAKATAFRASDRYQTVDELQAMVDSCLHNRYLSGENSSQELFHKDSGELSDIERIMVSIIAEEPEAENAPAEQAEEPETAQEEAASSAEEAKFPKLGVEPEQTEEKAVLSEEEEEMERIRALFNAPLEEPSFESDAVAQLPEEEVEQETLRPVPLAMSGEGEDVRVYQPTPHTRRENAPPERQPIPILTVENNPELAPVVPMTTLEFNPGADRQRQMQQDVQRRRRRPVAVVLVLCALLILSAIMGNAMLQGGSGIFSRDRQPAEPVSTDDASGVVSIPTAPPADPNEPYNGDQPFDYGSLDEPQEGDVPPASGGGEHRYEVVTSDASWTQARDASRDMGGYLAVVSTEEEYEQVVQLVADSGLSRVWLGCHRIEDTLVWETSDGSNYYPWDYYEPSYYDGYDGTAEDYLLLWYHNERWVYNDSRNDPVADYPELYSGNLGFVVEYDG